jgi:hypothetical protein
MATGIHARLSTLLLEHGTRYQHLQVQDVFKLLYQACMGSGHAVSDLALVRSLLENEIQDLKSDPEQPLIEQISPEASLNRQIVRVNLRRYMSATSVITPLLDAFIKTSNTFEGSKLQLGQYSRLLNEVPVPDGLSFTQDDLIQFMGEMGRQNYPAIHHSQVYTHYYKPAYRVVSGCLLEPILDVCQMN